MGSATWADARRVSELLRTEYLALKDAPPAGSWQVSPARPDRACARPPARGPRCRSIPQIHAANRAATERIRALGELPDDELRTPVGEHWTVAITLVHLAFWDRRSLHALQRSVEADRPVPTDLDIVLNDLSLPIWAAVPPREAIRLALEAATAIDEFVATLESPLADELLASHVRWISRSLHRNEHLDEAEAALRD